MKSENWYSKSKQASRLLMRHVCHIGKVMSLFCISCTPFKSL